MGVGGSSHCRLLTPGPTSGLDHAGLVSPPCTFLTRPPPPCPHLPLLLQAPAAACTLTLQAVPKRPWGWWLLSPARVSVKCLKACLTSILTMGRLCPHFTEEETGTLVGEDTGSPGRCWSLSC